MSVDLTVDDFVSGLLAALVRRRVKAVSTRGDVFYEAVAAGYERLLKTVDESDSLTVSLDFAVYLDPLYRDSPVIGEAITAAVQRNMISRDNPEFVDFRMKFGPSEADRILASLPGDPAWYDSAAAAFLASAPVVAV